MLGEFLGKLVATPIRIVDLPIKVISELVGNGDDTPGEAIAEAVEKSVENIFNRK